MAGNWRRWWKWPAWALALLVAPVLLYALASTIGAAIPVNNGWREPETGVRIFVENNGIHTGIVVPVSAEGVDWRDLVRPEDIADPRFAAHPYLAFGWGDREFYLNTPSWSDLDAARALRALIGSGSTVLHVERVAEPAAESGVRTILLRPDEYHRLAAFIRDSFATGGDGRAPSQHGYGDWDSFYAARGRYNLFVTCNEWTGRALRRAGVRIGAWTPLPWNVMVWLPAREKHTP